MTRESLYVASTRGREKTTWYAATEDALDVTCHDEPDAPQTIEDLLGAVLARTAAETSATETLRTTLAEAESLRTLVERYDHARNVAALEALPLALQALPAVERGRILADTASGQLARVVASAAGRGVNPSRLVRAAFDLDAMDNVRSPAADSHHPHRGLPESSRDPRRTAYGRSAALARCPRRRASRLAALPTTARRADPRPR